MLDNPVSIMEAEATNDDRIVKVKETKVNAKVEGEVRLVSNIMGQA